MKGPLSACMDWMHCVPASGGILQYETNQVLWRLRDEGVDILSDAMLESEQNFLGQEFKRKVELDEPSEDEMYAKMAQQRGMNEVGK